MEAPREYYWQNQLKGGHFCRLIDESKLRKSSGTNSPFTNGPYAFKTKLDWCIAGPVNGTSRKEICCNQIGVRQTDTNEVGKHFFQAKTLVKETDAKEILARL